MQVLKKQMSTTRDEVEDDSQQMASGKNEIRNKANFVQVLKILGLTISTNVENIEK